MLSHGVGTGQVPQCKVKTTAPTVDRHEGLAHVLHQIIVGWSTWCRAVDEPLLSDELKYPAPPPPKTHLLAGGHLGGWGLPK